MRAARSGSAVAFATGILTLVTPSSRLCGQELPVPYADADSPHFRNIKVDFTYAGKYRSIRAIDFRNFTLYAFDQWGRPGDGVRLSRGSREWREDSNYNKVDFERVYSLAPSAPGIQFALVMSYWFTAGGSGTGSGSAQVLCLRGDRLVVTQQVDWDNDFDSRKRTAFNPATKTLVVRSSHYLPGDAHCCISAVDVFSLLWNGEKFVQTSLTTELSDYGVRQGKTLPH